MGTIQTKGEEHLTPKSQAVLEMCVDAGIERGWHRAHKHNDDPDEQTIKNEIALCVMGEIYEWFNFEEKE